MLNGFKRKPVIVLANGCYDVFHAGHLAHLKEARAMGDNLIVALTVDSWVKKGPGRPINKWADRAALLKELRCVDEVIPSIGAIQAISEVRPTIFVKGIDYADGRNWTEGVEAVCKELGVELRFTTTPKTSAAEIIRKAMA